MRKYFEKHVFHLKRSFLQPILISAKYVFFPDIYCVDICRNDVGPHRKFFFSRLMSLIKGTILKRPYSFQCMVLTKCYPSFAEYFNLHISMSIKGLFGRGIISCERDALVRDRRYLCLIGIGGGNILLFNGNKFGTAMSCFAGKKNFGRP